MLIVNIIYVHCVLIDNGIDKRFPQYNCAFLHLLWSLLLLAPFLLLQVLTLYFLDHFLGKSLQESGSHHWRFLWHRRGFVIVFIYKLVLIIRLRLFLRLLGDFSCIYIFFPSKLIIL